MNTEAGKPTVYRLADVVHLSNVNLFTPVGFLAPFPRGPLSLRIIADARSKGLRRTRFTLSATGVGL